MDKQNNERRKSLEQRYQEKRDLWSQVAFVVGGSPNPPPAKTTALIAIISLASLVALGASKAPREAFYIVAAIFAVTVLMLLRKKK